MEHAVDVADRLWRQPTAAITPPIVKWAPVERREVGWCERLEYHASERRDDVTIDGHPVARPGGGPDPRWPHGGEPFVDQEGAEFTW